jgi:transposase-like protein
VKIYTNIVTVQCEAGRKLDITTKSLRTWVTQLEHGKLKASLGASKLTADQQRIRELERDILKIDGVLRKSVVKEDKCKMP